MLPGCSFNLRGIIRSNQGNNAKRHADRWGISPHFHDNARGGVWIPARDAAPIDWQASCRERVESGALLHRQSEALAEDCLVQAIDFAVAIQVCASVIGWISALGADAPAQNSQIEAVNKGSALG